MKLKKLTALLLAGMMVMTMAAGCGAGEEEVVDNNAAGKTDAAGETDAAEDEETAEIKVALLTLAPVDEADSKHVAEALNEMLLEKINVQAEFMWYDASSYATQIPMMIQAGEQLDLVMYTPIPGASYQSYMSQNQLIDITEYIDEYGENIKETMGDYLEATSKNGAVYGVGNLSSLYGTEAIRVREDVLKDAGVLEDFEKMATWPEFKDVLAKAVEKSGLNGVINGDTEGTTITPQPFVNGGEKLESAQYLDTLGDSYQYVYGNPETNKVECYFYNEDWLESMKTVKDFYDAGVIYKDASTSQDYGDTLIKNDVGIATVGLLSFGGLANFEAATGYDLAVKELTPALVTTAAFTKFGFGVPVTAEEPEAAVKLLNLLSYDTEVLNTLAWGVKDVDYVEKGDGTLTYPEGVTNDTVQYHTADFLYGNIFAVTPWEGEDPDIREQQKEANGNAELSPFFGFAVDSTPVSTQLAACKNVVDQYKPTLSAGVAGDVDATYEEFKAALDKAGMQDILEEYQKQLDTWLESK